MKRHHFAECGTMNRDAKQSTNHHPAGPCMTWFQIELPDSSTAQEGVTPYHWGAVE